MNFNIEDWRVEIEGPIKDKEPVSKRYVDRLICGYDPNYSLLNLYNKITNNIISFDNPTQELLQNIVNNINICDYREELLGFKNLPENIRLYLELVDENKH